ncbi:MAG TPA: hypothetical protein VMV69_17060 [Pirellulales bacterium]|nr:hypothetical protein [Pirellulales bacterium]
MALALSDKTAQEHADASIPHTSADAKAQQLPAWEQIEIGRFMPRRIRGSFRGGALG